MAPPSQHPRLPYDNVASCLFALLLNLKRKGIVATLSHTTGTGGGTLRSFLKVDHPCQPSTKVKTQLPSSSSTYSPPPHPLPPRSSSPIPLFKKDDPFFIFFLARQKPSKKNKATNTLPVSPSPSPPSSPSPPGPQSRGRKRKWRKMNQNTPPRLPNIPQSDGNISLVDSPTYPGPPDPPPPTPTPVRPPRDRTPEWVKGLFNELKEVKEELEKTTLGSPQPGPGAEPNFSCSLSGEIGRSSSPDDGPDWIKVNRRKSNKREKTPFQKQWESIYKEKERR